MRTKIYTVFACLIVLLMLASCVERIDEGGTEVSADESESLYADTVTAGDETSTEDKTSAEEETAAGGLGREGAGAEFFNENTDYGNIIISSYYGTGKNAVTPLHNGCIELYNCGSEDISLAGLSVYYGSKDKSFTEYRFDTDAKIQSKGSYLILCADPVENKRKSDSQQVFGITKYDVKFNLVAREDDYCVVLAKSEGKLDIKSPLTETAKSKTVFEWLSSRELDSGDFVRYISNTDSSKLVRKCAKSPDATYEKVTLTKANTVLLEQVCPKCSDKSLDFEVKSLIPDVTFSAHGGFYDEEFKLELYCPEGYRIYYTVNGDDPRTAADVIEYTGAITVKDTSAMPWGQLTKSCGNLLGSTYLPLVATQPGGITVKAYATDGTNSTTLATQTYFVGTALDKYGIDVLSLTVEPESFMSDSGIYVSVMRDVTGNHEKIPAYVEYFDSTGELRFASWTRIAMNGKGSLGMTQKSFRVIFDDDAAADGSKGMSTFDYDIFGKYATDTRLGGKMTYFNRILFRNGGGDNSGCTISRSHLGDAYIARADRALNVDTMAYAPVLTFINGEFWGIFNARERFDTQYFANVYNIPEDDVVMLEIPYPLVYGWNADYMVAYGEEGDEIPFLELVDYVAGNDMSVQENYDYVCSQLDVDNLIDHFCAQIYLNCSDWPSNNIKVWRNKNPDNGMDTKWRYCIVDTDHGVGLNSTVSQDLFGVINDGNTAGKLVNHLLQNKEFREKFIERYIWCIEVYFRPERMTALLDEMYQKLEPVMMLQLERWRVTDGSSTSWEKWYSYIDVIRNYVTERPSYAKQLMMRFFGLRESEYKKYCKLALERYGDTYND